MSKEDDLIKMRNDLRDLKDKYKDTKDINTKNMTTVHDLFILCTYFPEYLDALFFLLDEFLDEAQGGKN